MPRRFYASALGTMLCLAALVAVPTAASASGVTQVRAVYQKVLMAEYFGPASGVCSNLTAHGIKQYEIGTAKTCAGAFRAYQHVLTHKQKGVDNSGYTPAQWRREVSLVMAHLTIHVHGVRATAVGPSGIPGQTTLVKTKAGWRFDSQPPSVQS